LWGNRWLYTSSITKNTIYKRFIIKTFSVIGFGSRGALYANIACKYAKLSAVCDIKKAKLAYAKDSFALDDDALFSSEDYFFNKGKLSDYLFICNPDKDHYRTTIRALEAGYDVLLEKPIACSLVDCLDIEKTARRLDRKVVVCHVLRYTAFYIALKKLIDSGALGKIISIEQTENVGYWHQAHSFVRGNWKNETTSNPMILAKCCHDLDILVWLANSLCTNINSQGELNYFKEEYAPSGATKTCLGGCKIVDTCPYSAKKIYLDPQKRLFKSKKNLEWPSNVLVDDPRGDYHSLERAVRDSDYGRCVFHSDNNVVDHQVTQARFENGINATLIMTAFSKNIERHIIVRGTEGEVSGKMEGNKLLFQPFVGRKKIIRTRSKGGHGGGDNGLIRAFFEGDATSSITQSVNSHTMAFAAEHSRKNNGKRVDIKEYEKGQ